MDAKDLLAEVVYLACVRPIVGQLAEMSKGDVIERRMEADMRYLAGGGDPRLLDVGSRLTLEQVTPHMPLEPLVIDMSDLSAAHMIAFYGPGMTRAKLTTPDLDLPKPEYLHTTIWRSGRSE